MTEDAGSTFIEYPKHWALLGTGLALASVAVMAFLFMEATEDFAAHFWGASMVLVGLATALFLFPILVTRHELTDDSLRLRVGLLVDTSVPLSKVRSVRAERVVRGALSIGIGVRFHQKSRTLYVTPSFKNTVELRLNEELLLGTVVKHLTARVVVSVRDIEPFLDQLHARTELEA